MCEMLLKEIAAQSTNTAIILDSVSINTVTFGELFLQALEAKGLSQRKFADMVGAVNPHINLVISGKRTPPLDRIADWATALNLSGKARDEFELHAYLAHCPEPIRKRFLENEVRLKKLEEDYAVILSQLKARG
jgi:transcriptional regulator with XRE-family HTH domain